MRKIYMAIAALLVAGTSFAQTDTTTNNNKADSTVIAGSDTIRVGTYIIIKKRRPSDAKNTQVIIERKQHKPSKLSTNWWIFDLGFANVNDKTAYGSAEAASYLK